MSSHYSKPLVGYLRKFEQIEEKAKGCEVTEKREKQYKIEIQHGETNAVKNKGYNFAFGQPCKPRTEWGILLELEKQE